MFHYKKVLVLMVHILQKKQKKQSGLVTLRSSLFSKPGLYCERNFQTKVIKSRIESMRVPFPQMGATGSQLL